jgi:uncharacterized RDD family membrane protein YckC
MNHAPKSSRIIAMIFDTIIMSILTYIVLQISVNSIENGKTVLNIGVIILNILFLFKDLDGQSIGKKILGIRIVKINGTKSGFIRNALRNLFWWIGLVELIMLLIRKDNRRLGDIVLKTTVITN